MTSAPAPVTSPRDAVSTKERLGRSLAISSGEICDASIGMIAGAWTSGRIVQMRFTHVSNNLLCSAIKGVKGFLSSCVIAIARIATDGASPPTGRGFVAASKPMSKPPLETETRHENTWARTGNTLSESVCHFSPERIFTHFRLIENLLRARTNRDVFTTSLNGLSRPKDAQIVFH